MLIRMRQYIAGMFGIVLILVLVSTALKADDQITVAVVDFKNNTSAMRHDRLEKSVPEMLKTELSQYQEVIVVERSKIESILREQALGQTGVIENATAQEVGRLAGAKYIITGEINESDGRLRIDAHLIKVTSGQIMGEKVNGRNEESVETMVQLLANNLIFDLTGQGSHCESQKIHRYFPEWALATTAVLSAATIVLHARYLDNYDMYHDASAIGQFDDYYNQANSYHKARNVLLALSGSAALTTFILWQNDRSRQNTVYALLSGANFDQKLALGFAATGDRCLVSLRLNF
ncbi:MAG: CsgG/HfaB family protein [Candidatus Zhuqueibacterota bacterium]